MSSETEKEAPGIALVAHDACKQGMLEWARFNRNTLSSYTLYTTGTTGGVFARDLDLNVHRLLSGPYGGDAQIGALVAERRVRCVIFFWDPLTPQPHDVDVKALLRLTVLHNVPTACNRITADFLISSPLFYDSLRSTNALGFEVLHSKENPDLMSTFCILNSWSDG